MEYAQLRMSLDAECNVITEGLNGTLQEANPIHYCYGELPGNLCCESVQVRNEKMARSGDKVSEHCVDGLSKLAPNKWKSVTKANTKVGLGAALDAMSAGRFRGPTTSCTSITYRTEHRLDTPRDPAGRGPPCGIAVHKLLPKSFRRTLTAPSEMKRIQKELDRAQALELACAAGAAGAAEAVKELASQAFRILRGRRTVEADTFFSGLLTPYMSLGELVASVAVDKLFNTFFEAESYASKLQGEPRTRDEEVGLLQSMVEPGGMLTKVHRMFAHMVLEDNPDFAFICKVARDDGVDDQIVSRKLRGLSIHFSASFDVRFLREFHGKRYLVFRILNIRDTAEQDAFVESELLNAACHRCMGSCVARLLKALARPPFQSSSAMTKIIHDLAYDIAEDPYIISMYPCTLPMCSAYVRLPIGLDSTLLNLFTNCSPDL